MGEDLEDCVRRIEVAEARLEEQVKTFREALMKVEAMVSSFFDRQAEIKGTVEDIQWYGCQADHVKWDREKLQGFEKRLAALEAKGSNGGLTGKADKKLWAALAAVILLVGVAIGQSGAGPAFAQLIQKFVGPGS